MANDCNRCGRKIYTAWRTAKDKYYHPHCFTCAICNSVIESVNQLENSNLKEIYCLGCYNQYFSTSEESMKLDMPSDELNTECESRDDYSLQIHPEPEASTTSFQGTQTLTTDKEIVETIRYSIHDRNSQEHGNCMANSSNENENSDLAISFSSSPKFLIRRASSTSNIQSVFTSKIPRLISIPKLPQSPRPSISNLNNLNFPHEKGLGSSPRPCFNMQIPMPMKPQTAKMNEYIKSKGKFQFQHSASTRDKPETRRSSPLKAIHAFFQKGKSQSVSPMVNKPSAPQIIGKLGRSNSGIMSVKKPPTPPQTFTRSKPFLKCTPPPIPITVHDFGRHSSPSTPSTSSTYLKPPNPSFCISGDKTNGSARRYMLPHEILKGESPPKSESKKINNNLNSNTGCYCTNCGSNNLNSTSEISASASRPQFHPVLLRTPSFTGESGFVESCGVQVEGFETKLQNIGVSSQWPNNNCANANGKQGTLDCPICFEALIDLTPQSDMEFENVVTGCGHIFHKECINNWLVKNGNSRCPICSKFCLRESIIPVYVDANIAENMNLKVTESEGLMAILATLRSDYQHLKAKYQKLSEEHQECGLRLGITESLRTAYELECRSRVELQWENRRLQRLLEEMRTAVEIAQGDSVRHKIVNSTDL